MGGLIPGIKCKACGKPLSSKSIDVELCNECMEVVVAYNQDLFEEYSTSEFEKKIMDVNYEL